MNINIYKYSVVIQINVSKTIDIYYLLILFLDQWSADKNQRCCSFFLGSENMYLLLLLLFIFIIIIYLFIFLGGVYSNRTLTRFNLNVLT